jgi:hypothetical protein
MHVRVQYRYVHLYAPQYVCIHHGCAHTGDHSTRNQTQPDARLPRPSQLRSRTSTHLGGRVQG